MTRLTHLFLLLSGVSFILIGANTFHDPVSAMAGVELGVDSVNALNEVRANYGGMQIGIGLLLISALFISWLTRPALLTLALLTGGLVIGRLVSMAFDGLPNQTIQVLFGLESITAIMASFLFFQQTRLHREAT
jgi:hypothetical protein